jgi:hypothetical protein
VVKEQFELGVGKTAADVADFNEHFASSEFLF